MTHRVKTGTGRYSGPQCNWTHHRRRTGLRLELDVTVDLSVTGHIIDDAQGEDWNWTLQWTSV